MANICIYKIMVKGKKKSCYKLIDMMPLYSGEKYILVEEGTDDDFMLVFSGDCKWNVDSYTSNDLKLEPYDDTQLDSICDGFGWEIPLCGKSIVLDCEIFCNSKDIDSSCYADFVHYKKGLQIFDDCPKELHIKRGRDYDCYNDLIMTEDGIMTIDDFNGRNKKLEIVTSKVKFESGTYWYLNPENYEINDLVYVEGSKEGCLGKIIDIGNLYNNFASYKIMKKVGHAGQFNSEEVEKIWSSYKPKERKEYLKSIGINENVNKNKFVNIIESRWNEFCLNNSTWDEFIKTLN